MGLPGDLQDPFPSNPTGWLDITGHPGNTTSLYGVAPSSGGVDCVARSTSIPSSPSRISTTSARSTAAVNELGPCDCGFEGLIAIEFDPARGEVLGVDEVGRLLRISPTTGGVLESLGPTGLGRFGGITGLGFVAPEPTTGGLLGLGLCGLGFASRRRARVRA
jgi:PEP-CTERM motif